MMKPSPPFQNSAAEPERRPHEQEVVKLVEIPLVEQELVEERIALGERAPARPVDDVHVIGDEEAAEHHQRRHQRDQPRRCSISSRMWLSLARNSDVLPEALEAAADEAAAERHAGERRAKREHGERNEHRHAAIRARVRRGRGRGRRGHARAAVAGGWAARPPNRRAGRRRS